MTPSAFSQAFGISSFQSQELALLILDLSARLTILASEEMTDDEAAEARLKINKAKLTIQYQEPTPAQKKQCMLERLAEKKRIAEVNKARYEVLVAAAKASVALTDSEISELDSLISIVEES